MLKRIMLLMCLFALFAVPAYAADVTVQGETYTRYSQDTNMQINILPAGNSNPVLVISQWKNPEQEYTIEYDITAPQKGGYELQAVTAEIDSMYTSNFSFSINGGEPIYSGDVFKKISNAQTSYASGNMYLYSLGTVELNAGTNTVKFIIKELKETENMVLFYLDYFTLTKNTEFKLDSVTPTKPVSVFTDDDIVGFKLGYSMYPASSKNYTAIIEDYYHNRIKSTSFTLGTSELKKSLDFGKLSAGWYRLI
ncbi:MAG: hypothetical protein K5768_03455, partial [Firmicutes bacterium]|nr:hypothetical protein [Bacillota bacterium]